MKLLCILNTCFLVVCSMLAIQAQNKEVVITVDTLSPQVYMLTGQGGNIGIYVGTDHILMIDDQFDRLSEKIKGSIAQPQPIESWKKMYIYTTYAIYITIYVAYTFNRMNCKTSK